MYMFSLLLEDVVNLVDENDESLLRDISENEALVQLANELKAGVLSCDALKILTDYKKKFNS
jgi:hypothetical protein